MPDNEFEHFNSLSGNGPSRLLQTVKIAIQNTYSRTNVHGDGQVVVVTFSDGMKFEVLPAFHKLNYWRLWDGTYIYPDSNMGGNWLSTNPKAEQDTMATKNRYSNGLLFDTCKHIRAVKADYFPSCHLSGILIDAFTYNAIRGWHWLYEGEQRNTTSNISYEQSLFDYYNSFGFYPALYAPGSDMKIDSSKDWDVLGKVLKKMAL